MNFDANESTCKRNCASFNAPAGRPRHPSLKQILPSNVEPPRFKSLARGSHSKSEGSLAWSLSYVNRQRLRFIKYECIEVTKGLQPKERESFRVDDRTAAVWLFREGKPGSAFPIVINTNVSRVDTVAPSQVSVNFP